MEKRISAWDSVIVILSFIGFFFGVALIAYGGVVIIGTHIDDATGYVSATGLGILIGRLEIVAGIFLSCSLILGSWLLHLQPKKLILPAIIIVLFASSYGIRIGINEDIAWKSRMDSQRQEQAKIIERNKIFDEKIQFENQYVKSEKDKLEDEKILKKFESDNIVFVRFSFNYCDDHEFYRKTGDVDLATRKALNKKFVIDNIINPIGINDMPNFSVDDSSRFYIAEVTRAGYDKLRKNKCAIWIALWQK